MSHPWLRNNGIEASGTPLCSQAPFSRHPQAKALSSTEAFMGAASLVSCPADGEEGQDRELDGFFFQICLPVLHTSPV